MRSANQGEFAAAQGRRYTRRCLVKGDHTTFAIKHDRRTGQPADDLLDQLNLRTANDLLGGARYSSAADDCRLIEQGVPRTAQSARQAVGGGDIAAVVFNRHGQSASDFRSPSSLRIGAVTDVIISGFLGRRAPLKFSQSSRVPSIVNANANGTM